MTKYVVLGAMLSLDIAVLALLWFTAHPKF